MSDMFDLLKHSQIRKFIIMLGEREKHSRKIEIKEYEGFLKNINTVLTNFQGAVKLCKCMLISTSGSLHHPAQLSRHMENQMLQGQILLFNVLH